ncbi:cyclic AMP-dependent transcription factor ATF-3-like [Octopus vulgaris]|uniref:Cyclic AMP-dependent transcription factor ATF-3-like n=1 Tax=Octopus vulgaris TaxID=6645 RepID=A0AA36B774_OCTVU|nr:cyclic AMP-dependent transcription factor ATF-3-like [Octopus vulgaris]
MEDETHLDHSESMLEENSLYLPSVTDLDTDVKKTADICVKNNSLLPMIKLELKSKLQLKRHRNGQSLDIDAEPKPEYKMSPSEIQRRNEMKNRNKVAAKKYRDKQRMKKYENEMVLEELTTKNSNLKQLYQEMLSMLMDLKAQENPVVKAEPHP